MIQPIVEWTSTIIEIIGIAVITGGVIFSIFRTIKYTFISKPDTLHFLDLRRNLSQSILLGLEFLVAGDIISTVAVEPSFRSLGVLGGIVFIRTFLSFSLEVEMNGKWPWSRNNER